MKEKQFLTKGKKEHIARQRHVGIGEIENLIFELQNQGLKPAEIFRRLTGGYGRENTHWAGKNLEDIKEGGRRGRRKNRNRW